MRAFNGNSFKRNVIFYGVFALIFICIRSSVFASYIVPTASMNPTILEGDLFYTNKLAYRLKLPLTKISLVEWSIPRRGDIVVFKFPLDESKLYTKRVIGIPGDVVEIAGGLMKINGTSITRRFLEKSGDAGLYEEDLFGIKYTVQYLPGASRSDEMKRIVVPDGYLFVCGDNRDDSYDSRYWGLLSIGNVEGSLFFRWFSFDLVTHRPRFERIGLI